MKHWIILSLSLIAAPLYGQGLPVDDVTQLADPNNRKIEPDHRIKNRVPEKTPSGMTVYREAPTNPTEAAPPTSVRLSSLYDIEAYCKRIGEVAGNSYRIEQACRDQERSAFAALSATPIAPEIEKYCTRIGEVAGGSYRIMLACVQQEASAKHHLR